MLYYLVLLQVIHLSIKVHLDTLTSTRMTWVLALAPFTIYGLVVYIAYLVIIIKSGRFLVG